MDLILTETLMTIMDLKTVMEILMAPRTLLQIWMKTRWRALMIMKSLMKCRMTVLMTQSS
jgi:hypothetical protein